MRDKAKILELQLALLRDDPSALPRWGADGRDGTETLAALNRFKKKRGWPEDGVLDARTKVALGLGPPVPVHISWWQRLAVGWAEARFKETPMWEALKGKKTYVAVTVAAIAIVANHFFGPLPGIELDPDQWLTQLGALVFPVTIRAAIPDKSKVENGGSK